MVQPLDDARRLRRPRGDGTRVPPHNLQAEESLLGAMLLSRDAIVAAVEVQLGPDDFYKPLHGHIFDAITSLYARGEPADPVTVADELVRAGLGEAVGGPGALVALQANTPAIGNAGRYARIVEEHALLRRLIGVAGDIAEMGYSVPEDVADTIDQAEALIFDVAQRRVTDSLSSIRDLLERHLDHIEALYERGQDITGVPTGYIDLDQQLAGLQPANLVIVGGRPGTGKALSVDTPLPTPAGWTTMGQLRVGDEVIDDEGRPCRITYATPVMHGNPCYRVTFDDGSSIVADADHQWFAYDLPAWKSKRERQYRLSGGSSHDPARNSQRARDQRERWKLPRVVTTRRMLTEGLVRGKDSRPNWYVQLAAPLDLPERDLCLDPYLLGVWLGDGHADLGGPSLAALIELGVLRNKHIPQAYMRASYKQRLALLQGLLDAHGSVAPSGTVELCLANRALLAQVRELICSLGHRPGQIRPKVISFGSGRSVLAWRLSWVPLDDVFRLRRKAERLSSSKRRLLSGRATRRAIVSIAPVPSVPVRCITVAARNQMYLAGESMIPTHNTSFALGIAAHAALEARTPVLLFSLEMSHLELTQRMLCSEARVDATRMRNGRLLESDWPKISHAVGRLAESPIFIDDNPHLTVMEIRAKARRLKSRSGLGLIVVDYLQLMTGRPNAESRQVEVSEISRGLKILARELEVPVVALSQLSRNLETRADKRPVLADLRESGCMPASTRITRADNGEEVTLGELVLSQEQPLVWSIDGRQRIVPARLLKAFPSGLKTVFRLSLASGRSVEATANHPFLTARGWTRLDALYVGSRVAVPRGLPRPVGPRDRENCYVTTSPRLARDVQTLLLRLGIGTTIHRATGPRDGAFIGVPPNAENYSVRIGEAADQVRFLGAIGSHGHGGARTSDVREIIHADPDPSRSQLFWDEVVEIIPVGPQPTFDATIERTHNFLANGIVAHNSLEQDSDVVIFLYRDEVYNRDSPDRGTAEVIVAKHRNGPTGTTQLAFLDHYTRFANMAKGV